MDKTDPNQKLQAETVPDPIDAEVRAIWAPAPAADPKLRAKILAAIEREPENLLDSVRPAAIELAARRPEGSSRRLAGPQMRAPRRGLSRSVLAAMGAVVLLVGARIAIKTAHPIGPPSQASQGAASQVDPNELTTEDEQFALGGGDDDDSDDAPSVLELAADDEAGSE